MIDMLPIGMLPVGMHPDDLCRTSMRLDDKYPDDMHPDDMHLDGCHVPSPMHQHSLWNLSEFTSSNLIMCFQLMRGTYLAA